MAVCNLNDTLLLQVAITACELFGAVASFSRMPNLKTLADQDWRQAGADGFDIVAAVSRESSVSSKAFRSYAYSGAADEGPQAIFGRSYQVLEFGREDLATSRC